MRPAPNPPQITTVNVVVDGVSDPGGWRLGNKTGWIRGHRPSFSAPGWFLRAAGMGSGNKIPASVGGGFLSQHLRYRRQQLSKAAQPSSARTPPPALSLSSNLVGRIDPLASTNAKWK